MAVTADDRTRPLPPYDCGYCHASTRTTGRDVYRAGKRAARLIALAGITAACLTFALSACSPDSTSPAVTPAPSAAGSADLLDLAPACTNAIESETDKAASDGRAGTFTITVPPSCKGLSPAQVQALADEISANYAQGQAFASAFAQAMASINDSGGRAA